MRKVIQQIHLYLGLVSAIFLAILGVTGSIMAFENDLDHWLHPSLWNVTPGPRVIPEATLIQTVEYRFYPSRVLIVQFLRSRSLAQAMQLNDGRIVYVNPYSGTVQGVKEGRSSLDNFLTSVHRIHQMLVIEPRTAPNLARYGKIAVSFAALILCLMVPTGVILWWRSKRASIDRRGSIFKIMFDAHHVMGIYAALFLFIAGLTGVMIGFDAAENAFYKMTGSARPAFKPLPLSTPVDGGTPITADQAMAVARGAIPHASVAMIFVPLRPAGSYTVMMRVPEETSEAVHSSVTIDQFSGKALNVRNYMTDSFGYRLVRLNRTLHTGDWLGLPSHIVMSLSSLALAAMAVTGIVIWWKKLAL